MLARRGEESPDQTPDSALLRVAAGQINNRWQLVEKQDFLLLLIQSELLINELFRLSALGEVVQAVQKRPCLNGVVAVAGVLWNDPQIVDECTCHREPLLLEPEVLAADDEVVFIQLWEHRIGVLTQHLACFMVHLETDQTGSDRRLGRHQQLT